MKCRTSHLRTPSRYPCLPLSPVAVGMSKGTPSEGTEPDRMGGEHSCCVATGSSLEVGRGGPAATPATQVNGGRGGRAFVCIAFCSRLLLPPDKTVHRLSWFLIPTFCLGFKGLVLCVCLCMAERMSLSVCGRESAFICVCVCV